MKSVGAYDAKTHLPALLKRAAKGETIAITKHGMPVALLVPAGDRAKCDLNQVIEALRTFRKGRKLKGLSIKALIEEGRR